MICNPVFESLLNTPITKNDQEPQKKATKPKVPKQNNTYIQLYIRIDIKHTNHNNGNKKPRIKNKRTNNKKDRDNSVNLGSNQNYQRSFFLSDYAQKYITD